MPATTPVNVVVDNAFAMTSTTNPAVTANAQRATTLPTYPRINVTGVKRLVLPAPLRRWNGTTWVLEYTPKNAAN